MPPNTASIIVEAKSFQDNEFAHVKSKPKKKLRWYETETEYIWIKIVLITVIHVMAVYYCFTFPYLEHKFLVVWTFCMGHLTGLGITGGAHRLWSHRAYKAKTPLRIFLAICFYSSGQNKIFDWVRDHRLHHKYSETDADPHDINRGFWFSHVGWLMTKKKEEVRLCGKKLDLSDIVEDPVVQFFDGHHVLMKVLLTFVLPIFIPVYFLNQDLKWTAVAQIFIRYPWLLNSTWSVNSVAHMFGYRSYDKSIRPTQNIFVSFVAGGEGWHNYHHVFPWDYKAAELKNFFFNMTTYYIDMFAKFGWAYDLRTVSPDLIKRITEKRGDGSHAMGYGLHNTIKNS